MIDEPENGVRITITVEVIEDGRALPHKVERSVLDPHNPIHGLGARAQKAFPEMLSGLCQQLRPQFPIPKGESPAASETEFSKKGI